MSLSVSVSCVSVCFCLFVCLSLYVYFYLPGSRLVSLSMSLCSHLCLSLFEMRERSLFVSLSICRSLSLFLLNLPIFLLFCPTCFRGHKDRIDYASQNRNTRCPLSKPKTTNKPRRFYGVPYHCSIGTLAVRRRAIVDKQDSRRAPEWAPVSIYCLRVWSGSCNGLCLRDSSSKESCCSRRFAFVRLYFTHCIRDQEQMTIVVSYVCDNRKGHLRNSPL